MVNKNYTGVADGDLLISFNFRPDRALQIAKALTMNEKEFANKFDRDEPARPSRIDMITMTVYDPKLKHVKALFVRERVINTLSSVLGMKRVRQLRIAETEKYAHVTYFFNGLVEKPVKFEQRKLVPSQKIGTYDRRPEMSARKIVSIAVKAIRSGTYGFVLINFANADMVGHSGKLKPTIKAVETVDDCLGMIVNSWKKRSSELTVIVTADHGNAEKMYDEKTGQPFTAHTSNPVPLIVISERWRIVLPSHENIGLRDIAPTVLKIMGIRKPNDMTGRPVVSLLPKDE
jgi:2,3-bisphosphoglycerate-independent phosphoglycerate mutase